MALQPAALAQLNDFIGAGLGGQFVSHADLANAVAPLATQAQLAAVQTQLAAMQAQFTAMQVQLADNQVQLIAQMQALLAQHNAPAIAAAAGATLQAMVASRTQNSHDRSDVIYAVVPRADGTPPPHWPIGFDRTALFRGPIAVVDLLLADFDLPNGVPATTRARRDALALHIGTMRT